MPQYKDDIEDSESSSEEEVGDEESAYEPEENGNESPSSDESGGSAVVPEDEDDDDENSEAGEKDIDNHGEDIIAVDSDDDDDEDGHDGNDGKLPKKKASLRTKKPSTTKLFATKREEQDAIAAAKETIQSDPTRVPKLKPVTEKRPYKKKKKKFVVDDEELKKPTWTRKTENGGFAHTGHSKAKISAANSGNVAWNAGKNWSNSVRTKIALGVQARNRVILLEKLKRLDMTEEEWFDIKRKIKLKRERVRVIKKRNTNLQKRVVETEKAQRMRQEEYRQSLRDAKEQALKNEASIKPDDAYPGKVSKKKARAAIAQRLSDEAKKVFVPEIEWKPFEWNRDSAGEKNTTMMDTCSEEGDSDEEKCNGKDDCKTEGVDNTQNKVADQAVRSIPKRMDEGDTEYGRACPDGGPGGLVCCESCSNKYSIFLSQTSKDLQSQRVRNTSREVKRLMDIITNKQKDLEMSLRKARVEIPGRSVTNPMDVELDD